MKIFRNISLKHYNTLAIGSIACELIILEKKEELIELGKQNFFNRNEFKVLGGGSNILVKDTIVVNPILKIDTKGIVHKDNGDTVLVTAQAGENWHSFLEFCLENGYYGLENLALIPGSVGAAPIQNIGAYGVEQSERFHSLEAFSVQTGEFFQFDFEQCKFGYRDSIFKQDKGKFIITSVTYRLNKTFTPVIKYHDLIKTFENTEPENINPRELFNAVCDIRTNKLPYPDQLPNAGSFFKNPEISLEHYEIISEKYPNLGGFQTPNGIKIHAGKLIDLAGLKGFRYPYNTDAAVSDRHALVLVNHGNAAGMDIFELSELIINKVKELFGIDLEREVNLF